MTRKLSFTFSLMALGIAALAGSPASAATTAAGPYYATPSWDQTLPASTRFIVLSNFNDEAVLDRETGLVWQRAPGITYDNWYDAVAQCENAKTGGRFGWRLPTATELSSLLDPAATITPPLPAGHPFVGLPLSLGLYWTATVTPSDQSKVSLVGWFPNNFPTFAIATGGNAQSPKNVASSRTWCVRGGQGVGPY
jgi:hypothetical protein